MTSIESSSKTALTMTVVQATKRFREFFESGISQDKINADSGVISDVKVIGFKSRNGREYSPQALREALSMYEGARVYCDHSLEGRSVTERWGQLRNCRFVEGAGIFGDLHFLTKHPMTGAILESIARFGDSGLSHDAEGVVEQVNGKNVVTKLQAVYSVDFVESPATNRNLFESVQMKKKILVVLREGIAVAAVAGLLARLADSKLITEETEFEPSSDASALVEAVSATVGIVAKNGKDAADSLSQLSSIVLGGSLDDLAGKLKEATEKNAALESEIKALKESTQKSEARSACTVLLEAANVEVTEARLVAMVNTPEDSRKYLVESWPKKSQRPDKSESRFVESGTGSGDAADKLPASAEDFRKQLFG